VRFATQHHYIATAKVFLYPLRAIALRAQDKDMKAFAT